MTAGPKPAGRCPPLDDEDYVQAWRTFIEKRENARHMLVFDRSFIHHPPPNFTTKTAETRNVEPPANVAQPDEQPVPETKQEDQRDIPPLTEFLDEDEDEATKFHDYHREYNQWLLFLGGFALLNTIFIAKLTNTPTRQEQMILEQANNLITTWQAMQRASGQNITNPVLPITYPDEEVWVPALWYSSLILTVLNTLVVLLIKNWLMSCSVLLYRTSEGEREDDTDPEVDLEAHVASVRRRYEALKVRITAYRKARRAALAKTDLVRFPSYLLLFGAMSMFVAGALGKVWSIIFMAR